MGYRFLIRSHEVENDTKIYGVIDTPNADHDMVIPTSNVESPIIGRDLSGSATIDQGVFSTNIGNVTTEVYYEYIVTSSEAESSIIIKAKASAKHTLVRGLVYDNIFNQIIDFQIDAKIIKDDDRLLSLCPPTNQNTCHLLYIPIIIQHTKDLSVNDIRYFILKNCDKIGQTMGFTSTKYIGHRVFTINLNIQLSGNSDAKSTNLTYADLKIFEWKFEDFLSTKFKQLNELIHIDSVYVTKQYNNYKSDTRMLRAKSSNVILFELETGVVGEYYSIEIIRFSDIFDEMNNEADMLIHSLKDHDAFQFLNGVHIESLTAPESLMDDDGPPKEEPNYRSVLIGFSVSLLVILPLLGLIRWKMRRNKNSIEKEYSSALQNTNDEIKNKPRRKSSYSEAATTTTTTDPIKDEKKLRRISTRNPSISSIKESDLVVTKATTFDDMMLQNDKELKDFLSFTSQNLEKNNSTPTLTQEGLHSTRNIIIRTPSFSKPRRSLSCSKLGEVAKQDALDSLNKKQHSSCRKLQILTGQEDGEKDTKKSTSLQNSCATNEKEKISMNKSKTHSSNRELQNLLADFNSNLEVTTCKKEDSFSSLSNVSSSTRNLVKHKKKDSSRDLLSIVPSEDIEFSEINESEADSCKKSISIQDSSPSTEVDTKEVSNCIMVSTHQDVSMSNVADECGDFNEKVIDSSASPNKCQDASYPEQSSDKIEKSKCESRYIVCDNNEGERCKNRSNLGKNENGEKSKSPNNACDIGESDCKVRQHHTKSDKREISKPAEGTCDNNEGDKDRSHHKTPNRRHISSQKPNSQDNGHSLEKSQNTRPQRRSMVSDISKDNRTDKNSAKGAKVIPSSNSGHNSKEIAYRPQRREPTVDDRKEKASTVVKVIPAQTLDPKCKEISQRPQRRKSTADNRTDKVPTNGMQPNDLESKSRPQRRQQALDKREEVVPTKGIPPNDLESKTRPQRRQQTLDDRAEKAAVLAKVNPTNNLEHKSRPEQRKPEKTPVKGAKLVPSNSSEPKSNEAFRRPQRRTSIIKNVENKADSCKRS